MSIKQSFRKRVISSQTARLSQPAAWTTNLGMSFLHHNSNGSAMTASATANSPGAWVQYIASNAISANDTIAALHFVGVGNNQIAGTDNSMLMDIGTGAAGSEVIVAQNIAVGGAFNSGGIGPNFTLPVRIPGATRVACRVRAATGSRILTLSRFIASASALRFADRLPTQLDTLGTSTASSTGTAMSGSSGSWTEITGSTAADYQALVLIPSGPGSSSAATSTFFRLDLGIGAAGSEQAVAAYYGLLNSNGGVGIDSPSVLTNIYGGFVPAGSRIAVKHNLAANPERLTACVIGVPYV